jgi:hypothetical protein
LRVAVCGVSECLFVEGITEMPTMDFSFGELEIYSKGQNIQWTNDHCKIMLPVKTKLLNPGNTIKDK